MLVHNSNGVRRYVIMSVRFMFDENAQIFYMHVNTQSLSHAFSFDMHTNSENRQNSLNLTNQPISRDFTTHSF